MKGGQGALALPGAYPGDGAEHALKNLAEGQFVDDNVLRRELGDRYGELGDMVHQLKENLKRVARQAQMAQPLPLKMQHTY